MGNRDDILQGPYLAHNKIASKYDKVKDLQGLALLWCGVFRGKWLNFKFTIGEGYGWRCKKNDMSCNGIEINDQR